MGGYKFKSIINNPTLNNSQAFAADLAEEDRDRERKEAQAKNLEHSKQYKEAFDKIKKVYLYKILSEETLQLVYTAILYDEN